MTEVEDSVISSFVIFCHFFFCPYVSSSMKMHHDTSEVEEEEADEENAQDFVSICIHIYMYIYIHIRIYKYLYKCMY